MTQRLARIAIAPELACSLLNIPGGRVRAVTLNQRGDIELLLEHESFCEVAPGLAVPMRSVVVTSSNGTALPHIEIVA